MNFMIDTHCHLNDDKLINRAEEIVNNLKNDNLLQVIVVGYDFVSSKLALELAQKYENVYAEIGLHPSDATKWNSEFEKFLNDNLLNRKVVAVGEIGLDYHYDGFNKEVQTTIFVKQLEIADKFNLPVVIHVRDAMGDLIEVLKQHKHLLNNGGVIHCFNGSVDSYKILKQLGFKFSFGGAITFKNAKNAPKLLQTVSIDDILLETDCPYLTPEPFRGKVVNEPKYVKYVALKIAEYKNLDVNMLIENTNKNTYKVFKKLREKMPEKFDIKFNKSFGQNFIFDTNLLKAIVSDAGVDKNTDVLEIGTGAGTLTKEIALVANKVVSYEIDSNLMPTISNTLSQCDNVKVVFNDVMKEDIKKIESNFESEYVMVANLPYYITTPIIFKFLETATRLKTMVIMVQKEVAERLCAKSGTSQYGAITAVINSIANTRITRIVKRNMFVPAPNVDSAVVRIDFIKDKFKINNFDNLSKLIKCAFHMRRKTLVNNLKNSFNITSEKIDEVFELMNLDKNVRGEVLSPQQFVQLSNLLFD